MNESAPQIVVIGGGTGSSVALSGLRSRNVDLTAIVTAFDSGGSSGRLREEFGHLSLGDIRRCLVALAEDSPESEAFRLAAQYRFSDESSLNGHNLGNLFLSALTMMHGDIEVAVEMMARMLRIKGQVVPVALDPADLCAELIDGSVLRGEATIDLRRADPPAIKRVYLDQDVKPNSKAIEAIRTADAVVLGPGDIYTSIVPNLLVNGISEAIRDSSAMTVFACNLMTKRGETDGFHPADFVREISTYLGGRKIDAVLLNNTPATQEILDVYASVKATPVVLDSEFREQLSQWSHQQISMPLSQSTVPPDEGELRLRHDPQLLADAILDLLKARDAETSDSVLTSGHHS